MSNILKLKNLLLLFIFLPVLTPAQSWFDNRSGITEYNKGEYEDAQKKFQKARKKIPDDPSVTLNISSTLYKQEIYNEAGNEIIKSLRKNPEITDSSLYSSLYYNLGNSFFKQESLGQAIEFYKSAVRLNSNDLDAKYNLELLLKIAQQQQQNQRQNQQQEQQKEGNQQQQQQNKRQDQQNQDQPEQQQAQNQQQEQQQQQEGAMSKEDAERLMDAFRRQEQEMIYGQSQQQERKTGGSKYRNQRDW
jgi:tetratricopeptide (TPR) repeat protein